jgi:hypothetical protein
MEDITHTQQPLNMDLSEQETWMTKIKVTPKQVIHWPNSVIGRRTMKFWLNVTAVLV